ncbi:MAG: hypothetical protein ABIN96_04550 [Rubrivivax sp.]
MHRSNLGRTAVLAAAVALLAGCAGMSGQQSGTTFFVTSVGSGKGGDLGGLAGADAHCQKLATAAGAGNHTWRAYLSTQPSNSTTGVNARDRIGKGPWQNAKGVVVATDVAQLHGSNNITKATSLTEKGEVVNGPGDTPNHHDLLTGSQPNGTFIAGDVNSTCANWQQSTDGAAMLGHSDRTGLDESAPARSWNSSHQSRGCSGEQLKSTGGIGLFYCFAGN